VVALFGLFCGSAAAEPTLDPTLPIVVTVGEPKAPAAAAGLGATRSGRTPLPLPERLSLLWQVRLGGRVEQPIAATADGHLVVATGRGQLVELDRAGKRVWQLQVEGANISGGPVIRSDGLRLIVTSRAELLGIDGDGKPRLRQQLPKGRSLSAPPLPLADGGVLLAFAEQLMHVDAFGRIAASGPLPAPVTSLVSDTASTYAVTRQGDVFTWTAFRAPRRVGSFGRTVDHVVAAGPGRLGALAHPRSLVTLNLTNGARASFEAPAQLLGPIAATSERRWLVFSEDGLLSVEPSLRDHQRVFLATRGGEPRSAQPAETLIVSDAGRAALGHYGGVSVLGLGSGAQATLELNGCGTPVSLVPAGSKRIGLGCRSGLVAVVGEPAPE